jgi:hypothetical protein
MPLNDIATEQTKAMEKTQAATNQMLDYLATHPDATIRYHASDMVLHIHSNASYLSVSNARSHLGGLFFLGNKYPEQDALNGSILDVAAVIKNVVASAAESEVGACFHNAQSGAPLRGPSQQINVGYAKIFTTGQFMSACSRWNEKPAADKTWTHFKSHFAAAHRQHKQMKGETAAHARFHSANAAMTQTEDHMAEAIIGALANLATATAADRCMVAALTQDNARLVKQLEETSSELRKLRALHHQERRDRRVPRNVKATANTYCWTHGYKVGRTHTSLTCTTHNPGHKTEAARAANMGGTQANKE